MSRVNDEWIKAINQVKRGYTKDLGEIINHDITTSELESYVERIGKVFTDQLAEDKAREFETILDANISEYVRGGLQRDIIGKFIEEKVRLKNGDSPFVATILISRIIDDCMSKEQSNEVVKSMTRLLNSLKRDKLIDRNLDIGMTVDGLDISLELLHNLETIIVPLAIEDSFSMAYNLVTVNWENVKYAKNYRECEYVEKQTTRKVY